MDIHKVIDNDDGSCTVECTFTSKEVEFLLSYAVTEILKEQIKIMEDQYEQGNVGC